MVIQMNEEHVELVDTFATDGRIFFFFFFFNQGQVTPTLLVQCYGSG